MSISGSVQARPGQAASELGVRGTVVEVSCDLFLTWFRCVLPLSWAC